MPLAAENRVTLVPRHPTGSVLPQRNLDPISATSGSLVRLGQQRHGVEVAAGAADGELRPLPGALLPSLPE